MANHPCPNINSPIWKELVEKVGIFEAYKAFRDNGYELPDPKNYSYVPDSRTNYALKIVGVLLTDKVQKLYDKFYKNNPEKFYSELVPLAGKEQVQILRDYNNRNSPTSLQDMLTGIMAEMSYTVEVNTAMTAGSTDIITGEEVQVDGKWFRKVRGQWMDSSQGYENETPATLEQIKKIESLNKDTPTQHYSNLTVPGGTNYTENEIATPGITPSIKGHAQFSTDQGIGWFRSDEQGVQGDWNKWYAAHKDDYKYFNLPIAQIKDIYQEEINKPRKTRRILELQSDLFQKGRDKDNLVTKEVSTSSFTNEPIFQNAEEELQQLEDVKEEFGLSDKGLDRYNELKRIIKEGPSSTEIKQNAFLQLLNKDGNWIPFFIKTIVQDSAKKGYEKVLFPTGDTASKIEGHETLEEFKKQKEDRIKELETLVKHDAEQIDEIENKGFKVNESLLGDNFPFTSNIEEQRKSYDNSLNSHKDRIVRSENEIKQLQEELKRVETEGIAALKPIYNFYENRVYRELEKMYSKEGISRIKDEYGNSWYEVEIVPEVDKSTIYYQLGTSEVESADRELDQFLLDYLKPYGVKVKDIEELKKRFDIKDALGVADVLNKVIYLSKNNRKIDTMAEETAHVITMLMGRDHPLFRQIFNNIERHSTFNDVYREYMPIYNNLEQVKKEAVDKLIAEAIVNGWRAKGSKKERNWLQKIIDAIKKWWDNFINKNQTFTEYAADKKVSPTAAIIAEKIFSRDMSLIYKAEGKERLDYKKALSGNEHAKNTINLFTDYFGFRLTGSLAIAGQGEGINRPSESPIHDLDFIVSKDFDIEKMDVYMKNMGAIPTHSGIFSKTSRGDVSSTYAYLVPAEGYSVEAAHRKTSKYWTEFADEVILRDNKGKEIFRGKWDSAPADKLLNVDFFDNYEKNQETTGKYKSWQDIYFGKMILSNLGDKARLFPRSKDQVDYIEHNPVQRDEIRPEFLYLQKEASTELPNEQLDKKVKGFLSSVGVSVKNIPEGEFAGRVDTINKIIEVVDGKAGIDTLSHEATHMFLDMLPDNSPILKEILDDVVTRPEYVDIYEQYKDDPEYQTNGEVDEEKMAKEAAAHIIDDIIVGKFKEKAALKWWQKLWNWIKSKFSGKNMDAYEQVAEDILSGYTGRLDKNKVGKGIYKQIPVDVAAKMQKQRDRLKKEVTEYAKALKDKDSTSTEQKDVISAIVLKEDTNSKLGLRPSPKVELEDKTHIYTDESGIVYNSTTKKITGEFSADKAAQYELNKDVGNDIDALGTAAVLGKSFDDIKKLITPTLPDDYKYRIYGDMLKFVDTITSNGEIAIPQVVVSDPVSKTAGSIDIYTIDRNGNQRVYDVKSSINEVKEGRSDTYLSEWQQNPGSVFNGLTYKDGEMVVRQEGDEPVRLSKKLQHSIQTGSYSRMLELQGGPVVGLYSKHFNVELDHVNWKIKSYKDEGLISHGIEDNKPYIDQVVPTQVDENNLSELQKNRIGYDIVDSDSPTDEEKKEAKEEFQQPLEGTPEIKGLSNKIHEFLGQRIEHIKRLLRNKPDDIHIFKEKELLALEDIRTVVGAAIDKEAYSSLLNTYMDYTINQANNTSKFLKKGIYNEKGELNNKYLDVTRMASAFLEGYRDIADIMASIPDTQIPKFENMMKALKAMEDAIYTGNMDYLEADIEAGGYQYTKQERSEAIRGSAKDIGVLSRNFLGPSATSSVLVSVFFDTVRKAIFTAVDQSKEDAAILDNALRDLRIAFPNTSDEKITDYIINKSDMTFVQRVGKEYEDMKQAAKDALINPETGERYEYRIGNDKETLEYNKELHDKVATYSQLTQAEKWVPAEWDPVTERVIADGYYEEGEYCEYAPVNVYDSDGNITKVLDYKVAREYNERKNNKGKWEMKGSADNGATIKWKEEKGIFYHTNEDGSLGERLSAKEKLDVEAFWYRSTYMMAIPDKYTPEYENGEFTGKVIANPEGTIKWVVKGEFKQVRDKSLSGKDLRDPKYIAIMTDNSLKAFYNTYMDLRHKLSLKLPKAQRKNFMKYVDAVPVDTLAEAYRTGGIKKMTEVMSKQGKKFADISSEPAREVELDEKGDVIQGIPLPIIGRYNERRVKELSDELKAATTPTEKRRLKKLLDKEKAKVKPQDISTDIVHNTKKVSNSIREYDNMSKAESKLLAIQQVANSKIARKKIPMTDAEGQNIFVKTVKGVLGKIAAMTDNNGYTNEAGMIRDMMNMLVNKDVPYKDTTAAKIEGLLITLLSLRYFAFNPPIAFMGRMGNRFLVTWPEGVIGEFFNRDQTKQAEIEIQKSIILWSKNRAMQLAGGGTKFASKLEAWADKFQLHPGSHFSDKTLKSSPQHFTEWTSLMAYAMPIGMNTPIKGQDGTISNLWNIFTFDSNTGELKIDKNFEKVFNDQNFKYKLFTKVFDFQNRYEGFYNKMEAFTITQYPGGRSLAFLKKHLPSIVQRIGAAPWVHSNLGYSEGSWYTLWALTRDMKHFEGSFRKKIQMGMREVIPKGAVGNKNYWKMNEEERKKADDNAYSEDKEFHNADGTINEEKVERDRQKRRVRLNNLKRDLAQVVSVCVFTGAYLLFKALAEDDETEARRWNNYLARTFDKLRKQQMFSIPLAGFEEQYQLLKSPIASLRVVGDFADTMGDAIGLAIPGVESRYTTGVHAGEYKAWVKTKKMIPVLNLDPYLDELNSANYYIR